MLAFFPATAFTPLGLRAHAATGISRNTLSQVMSSSPSPAVITTEAHSLEGKDLLREGIDGETFAKRWHATVQSVGLNAAKSSASEVSLESRMREVRKLSEQRHVLVDCMALGVEQAFVKQQMPLLASIAAIGPNTRLPQDVVTFERVSTQMLAEPFHSLNKFVTDMIPTNHSHISGRLDRMQGAALFMGCIQYGYFLSELFRGGYPDLDPDNVPEEVDRASRGMKSEVAWAAASRRAARFFKLHEKKEDTGFDEIDTWKMPLGFEELRVFARGLTVAYDDEVEKHFRVEGEAAPTFPSADVDDKRPVGDFVPFNQAGLQTLLAEGCLYGWHLWAIEVGIKQNLRQVGGDDVVEMLLTAPPEVDDSG